MQEAEVDWSHDPFEDDVLVPHHETIVVPPEINTVPILNEQGVSPERYWQYIRNLAYVDDQPNPNFLDLEQALRAEFQKLYHFGEMMKKADMIGVELNGGIGDMFYYTKVGIAIAEKFPEKKVVFIDRSNGVKQSVLTPNLPSNIEFVSETPRPPTVEGQKQKVFLLQLDRVLPKTEQWQAESKNSDALYFHADPIVSEENIKGLKKLYNLSHVLPFLVASEREIDHSKRKKNIEKMMALASVDDSSTVPKAVKERSSRGLHHAVSLDETLFAQLSLMGMNVPPERYKEINPVLLPERPKEATYDVTFFYGAAAQEGKKSTTTEQLDIAISRLISENPEAKIGVVVDLATPEVARALKDKYPQNVELIEGKLPAVFETAAASKKIVFPDTGAAHYFSFVVSEWRKNPDEGLIPQLYEICGASIGFELGLYVTKEPKLLITSQTPAEIPGDTYADFVMDKNLSGS